MVFLYFPHYSFSTAFNCNQAQVSFVQLPTLQIKHCHLAIIMCSITMDIVTEYKMSYTGIFNFGHIAQHYS